MNEKDYWNDRYRGGKDSGYGSYGVQLERKVRWTLNNIEGVTSISDVGCGDISTAKSLLVNLPDASYIGYDISDEIIRKNRALYPRLNFEVYEGQPIQEADLVLCLDVLLHIFNAEDEKKLLDNLDSAWTKYLVMTAYERDEEMRGHVRIRRFDPSRFGIPILKEVIEEDGTLYFYIFKR